MMQKKLSESSLKETGSSRTRTFTSKPLSQPRRLREKECGLINCALISERTRFDKFGGLLVEKPVFQIGWKGGNKKPLEPSNIAPT
jgi:hypothetical protein